jgi:hypothetical protein
MNDLSFLNDMAMSLNSTLATTTVPEYQQHLATTTLAGTNASISFSLPSPSSMTTNLSLDANARHLLVESKDVGLQSTSSNLQHQPSVVVTGPNQSSVILSGSSSKLPSDQSASQGSDSPIPRVQKARRVVAIMGYEILCQPDFHSFCILFFFKHVLFLSFSLPLFIVRFPHALDQVFPPRQSFLPNPQTHAI